MMKGETPKASQWKVILVTIDIYDDVIKKK